MLTRMVSGRVIILHHSLVTFVVFFVVVVAVVPFVSFPVTNQELPGKCFDLLAGRNLRRSGLVDFVVSDASTPKLHANSVRGLLIELIFSTVHIPYNQRPCQWLNLASENLSWRSTGRV